MVHDLDGRQSTATVIDEIILTNTGLHKDPEKSARVIAFSSLVSCKKESVPVTEV